MSNRSNGPVITGTVNIYYIWYGNWDPIDQHAPEKTVLTNFASAIGGSPYFMINTTYPGGNGPVSGQVAYAGSSSTGQRAPYGTNLSIGGIQQVVSDAVHTGGLPLDPNGVYFVLTSAEIGQTNGNGEFCGQDCNGYCGWHDRMSLDGTDIKYSFVGNPNHCPTVCIPNGGNWTSPNGIVAGDIMATIVAHELEESTTDPDIGSWTDGYGWENADKCAWQWGNTYTAPNGAMANMRLGPYDYLIQQNWVNHGAGYCALQLPAPPRCSVYPGCTTEGVAVDCFGETGPGDMVFERQNGDGSITQFATVPAAIATTQYLVYETDHPTQATGSVSYRVCTSDTGGRYCSPFTPVSMPLDACPPPHHCPRGTKDCGDGVCIPLKQYCQ